MSSQELRWQPADEAVERLESVEVRLHSNSRNRANVSTRSTKNCQTPRPNSRKPLLGGLATGVLNCMLASRRSSKRSTRERPAKQQVKPFGLLRLEDPRGVHAWGAKLSKIMPHVADA